MSTFVLFTISFSFFTIHYMNKATDFLFIKNKFRLGICLTTSDWSNILYNKAEMYERFDTMLKEADEEYRTTLINFAKY